MTVDGALLRIAQLYPAELGITGDRGNVDALRLRLELAGARVETLRIAPGDDLPGDLDVLVIGNGPLSALRGLADDIARLAPELRARTDDGAALLAVGGGMELLGHEIRTLEGETVVGAGVLPVRCDRDADRRVGYVVCDTPFGELVAFEDYRASLERDPGVEALGTITRGVTGSRGSEEGVRAGTMLGTRLQGPVLPLNPAFTDELLRIAAARRGLDYTPGEAHRTLDEHARRAREVMLANIDERFGSISAL